METINQGSAAVSSVHIVVHGASGRMGARICALVVETPDCTLRAAIARAGSKSVGTPAVPGRADTPRIVSSFPGDGLSVIIDFSSPDGAAAAADAAESTGTALLVGTTGLGAPEIERLERAGERVPVLLASNTSLGVAILSTLAASAAKLLGAEYDCSIVESHHAQKKDAPSGTARRLTKVLRDAGARVADEQVLAMRGGDVYGEHTIRFAGAGEYIELTHRATTRDLFARGAIRAAQWLVGRKPGWYTMDDVLGIRAGAGPAGTSL
ncbi:MAG: 4-hydroxy-tetrahydrodipicolinate reductase [Phycisphaerales bacterium]